MAFVCPSLFKATIFQILFAAKKWTTKASDNNESINNVCGCMGKMCEKKFNKMHQIQLTLFHFYSTPSNYF